MQFSAILFFLLRIMVVPCQTQKSSHARIEAVERKISNIRHESESILLPRTSGGGRQPQNQDPISRTRTSNKVNREESSQSPSLKRQPTGARPRIENSPSNSMLNPQRPFDRYESQRPAMDAKEPERNLRSKLERNAKAVPSGQKTEELDKKEVKPRKWTRTREQKDERNAQARQERKEARLERGKYSPTASEQEELRRARNREYAQKRRAEKGDTINAGRRRRYREKKIEDQRRKKVGVDVTEKTSSTDNDPLAANSKRYNFRTRRSSKVPEESSSGVSVDFRTHERSPGSDRLSGTLPGQISSVEPAGRAPSENAMQQMFQQFQDDEL